MSIALLFNQKDTKEWEIKLRDLLPKTKIEVYPNIDNTEDVEFLITWKPHENYVNEFPNLKVVQSVGAGIDHLLHTPLDSKIKIARIVDENLKHDMFEHVLTCILASMKNFPFYQIDKGNKIWEPKSYKSINKTEITILGLGEIGKFVAEKLYHLGFIVNGWSNSAKDLDNISSFYGENQFYKSVESADFIINLLPLTPVTENILNASFFNSCKPNSVLINVGRGRHLNEIDLLNALEMHQIKAAYLDVFTEEPLNETHPFWTNNKVFITPHVASLTNVNSAIHQIIDNYVKFKQGEKLNHEVDLKRGY